MSQTPADFVDALVITRWQPRSLQVRQEDLLRRSWRIGLLAGIALLHVLAAGWFAHLLAEGDGESADQVAMVLDFPAPSPASKVLPKPAHVTGKRPLVAKPEPASRPDSEAAKLALAPGTSSTDPETAPRPASKLQLQLFTGQGRLRVPDDLLEQIDRQVGDQRVFSYQIPHIDDARKYFDRKPVLPYQTTRFDQYWKPDQDMLTELLTKLVEKTTRQVKIPVPGHPDSTMVCTISLLALSGGCGLLTNGSDYVGPVDDPDTLDHEEDRQCQAWWNQITGAKTQEIWRKTRALYEGQCRKPLAREK